MKIILYDFPAGAINEHQRCGDEMKILGVETILILESSNDSAALNHKALRRGEPW